MLPCGEAHAREHRGEQRQVDGHRQVLDDEHPEDDGRLPVAEPPQIREDLGDHPGRRDPGDPGQGHRPHGPPAEQQRGDGTGGGVEDEVHGPGRILRLQTGDEFTGAVFEPQQEQQQDDADLGADGGELLARAERQQPAVTEGESGQQVEGDRGKAYSAA